MATKPCEITVAELKERLDQGKVEFLFDMRNPDEFESWRIEGPIPVETLNIPQLDFVGEEEKYLDQLPKDKEIVVVCAHGGASTYTAELLQEKGYRAVGIAGGMDAWSEYYETHQLHEDPAIFQIHRVAKGCITHVILSNDEAVVIDAVRHIDHIIKVTEAVGARVKAVIDTHLQADHISGGRELAAREAAEYWINPLDAAGATYAYQPLEDGVEIRFGFSRLTAIHSPGHTPGSTSLLLDGRFLFTGDTIMKSSLGRPDLGGKAGEWSQLLYDTLFNRFSALDDQVVVLPSHAASPRDVGPDGTVRLTMGEARKHELYQVRDPELFAQKVAASLLENPERYQDIRKVNLGQLAPEEDKLKELEIGKNLCGMAGKQQAA